jgi:aminomethyltransferase
MNRTPLYHAHLELNARMVDFAGWEMPVQYAGTLKEHLAVRTAAGLFDVSHMGQIEIRGPKALDFTQGMTCNDLSRLTDGQAQYSALLYPEGTFVDDVVIYRIHARYLLLCVNASNREKDYQWLLEHRHGDVEIRDASDEYAQLALQGPRSQEILERLTLLDLDALPYYWFTRGRVAGADCLVSRTGYTGEDGFELYLSPSEAAKVWDALLDAGKPAGIRPAGLAARNTLRLEVRYLLYGNDIDETTNAWEAGLGWIVDMDQGPFSGRESLYRIRQEGPARKLVGFEITGRGIARDHDPVLIDGARSSQVSSGSYSPSGKKSIGLVYLPVEKAVPGQEFEIENRRRLLPAVVVKTPFYRRS